MASAAPLKDIDEQFLQCSICLEQLKEPKLLPCLHRYCRNCLKKIVKKGATKVQCPTCREKHDLPKDGVDGLKTDFNTQNIVEFFQLQDSIKHEPLRVCVHCSKTLKVSAYCFKCNNFLCKTCHEHHMTNMIVKDHRPHIFSLSEIEARNLTIEKLTSLKEAPRCSDHPERLSELCCTACGNLPICVACTYGAHQGHNLKEVKALAKIERGKLKGKLDDLMQYKEKIYKMQEEIRKTKEKLNRMVDKKKTKVQEEFDIKENQIKLEFSDKDEQLDQQKTIIEEKFETKISSRKQKLEVKMRELRENYDKACEEERREADAEFQRFQEEIRRDKAKLQERLDGMNKEIRNLLTSLKTQKEKHTKKISELSDHFEDLAKRFENVTTTASSIVAANHDWTDVQCIPDICGAIVPLIKEVKRELPELETFSDVTVGGLSSVTTGRGIKVDVTEKKESVVNIEGMTGTWKWINRITSSKDGSIIITGRESLDNAHITVINMEGKQLRKHILTTTSTIPWCFCDYLSQFNVATVCVPDEIGLYNVRDGSYRKTNISDVIRRSSKPEVRCVAVDHVNNYIHVGCTNGNRDVYVFDGQLRYIHTLKLPPMFKRLKDMTVHGGALLICEYESGQAYAVTMERSACNITYQFSKPDVDGGDYRPLSVCTDKNGFIYILWKAMIAGQDRAILAQYKQDSGQILTTRSLDKSASCITTVETEQGEKIVIATFNTGILFTRPTARI